MTVLQVRDRTTKSQTDFEAASLSSNSLIYSSASDDLLEEFSLELTLGNGWNERYSVKDRALRSIHEGVAIKAGESIVVEVAEEIRVPHNRYGIVLSTGSLFLSQGVLVASAKVEPAFLGKLKLRLYNTAKETVRINKGEKLGSIIFFATESTRARAPILRASEISLSVPSPLDRLFKWLGQNKIAWIGWMVSVLGGSTVAMVLGYFLYYKPLLEVYKGAGNQRENTSIRPGPAEKPLGNSGKNKDSGLAEK